MLISEYFIEDNQFRIPFVVLFCYEPCVWSAIVDKFDSLQQFCMIAILFSVFFVICLSTSSNKFFGDLQSSNNPDWDKNDKNRFDESN